MTAAPIPEDVRPRFLHSDSLCERNSVDADGFLRACREFARLSDALELPDTGHSFAEVTDIAIDRLRDAARASELNAMAHRATARRAAKAEQQRDELRAELQRLRDEGNRHE